MDCNDYDYSNDWCNDTGISDDEMLYRLMNPEDVWYMGEDDLDDMPTLQSQPPQQINITTYPPAASTPPNTEIIQSDPDKQGNWFG